jgi:hypothetical protein
VSFISVLSADTGDFLALSDPKDAAGQRAWERATAAAISFAQNPGEVAGAKLLALIGERSSLGDPTEEDWLPNLPPGMRAVALEQLAQLTASWYHLSGRNVDGTRNVSVDGVVTMTPQSQAVISRPATKAATADALRVAATQAGPQRADFAARAAATAAGGPRELADQITALRAAAALAGPQRGELLAKAAIAEQQAADLAKAAAARASSRRRTWGDLVLARRLDIGPTATQRRIATQRAAALAKAASADEWDGPAWLEKAGGRGRA